MKKLLLLSLLLGGIVTAAGQENGEAKKKQTFSIFLGGAVGNFGISADKFNDIYSNRSISRIYLAGIGSGSTYIVGKYRSFFANGRSKVENAEDDGKAEWKQKFYNVGVRLMPANSMLYLEMMYSMTEADERITTVDSSLSSLLTSQFKTKAQGVAFSLGIALDFPRPLRIFGEVEYSAMLKSGLNPSGRKIPELGGICLSGGIILVL